MRLLHRDANARTRWRSVVFAAAIVCSLQVMGSGQVRQDDRTAWMRVDRPTLTLTVDLASEISPGDIAQRDQALDQLYEQIETADAERVFALEIDIPDSNFTVLVAAETERPIAYLQAMRRSFGRYHSAEAADHRVWKAKHLTAAKKYAALAALGLAAQAKLDEESAARLQATPFAVRRSAEKAQAFLEGLKRDGLSESHRKLLTESGLKEEEINAYQKALVAMPPGEMGMSIVELYRQIARVRREVAAALHELATDASVDVGPLSQTFTVGNPHDKEETVDLFIRRASIPPDWTASIVATASAPAQGDKPQGPQIQVVEAGRHYRVQLPAKGEIRVSTVLVPAGAAAENTTARWTVEGKIGDELLGGIVQEMQVPAYLPDLKLPAVGSVDTRATDGPLAGATVFKRPVLWIFAGITLLLGAVVWLVFFWRRRQAHARRD